MSQPLPGYPGYPPSGMSPFVTALTGGQGVLSDIMHGIEGQQNYLGQYGGQYLPPQSYYIPPGGYPAPSQPYYLPQPGYGGAYSYPTPQSSHGLGKELAAAALGAMGGAALGTVLEEHHHHRHHHDNDDDGENGGNGDGNGNG